jgi:hypothetical protein
MASRPETKTTKGIRMTKKDYELVARVLRMQQPHESLKPQMVQWLGDVDALADEFEVTNTRFDRALFLRACGVIS